MIKNKSLDAETASGRSFAVHSALAQPSREGRIGFGGHVPGMDARAAIAPTCVAMNLLDVVDELTIGG